MGKIKDLLGVERLIKEAAASMLVKQSTISSDLYASIKEVAELKYRMMELEVKVDNLAEYVKTQNKKGD